MNKKPFIFLLILLVFSSCKKQDSKEILQTITFDIPFEFGGISRGIYYDSTKQRQLIYISEPFTQKKIVFYDLKGAKVDSVPLKEINNIIQKVEAIFVRNLDSIVVFGSEKIVLINQRGNVKFVNDLTKFAANEKGDLFMFRFSSLSNFSYSSKKIYVNCSWYNNAFDDYFEKYKIGTLEFGKYYYEQFLKNPDLIAVNNYLTDSISITFSKENNYKKFLEKPSAFSEAFYFREIEGELLLFSHYSNLILRLDKKTMDLVDKIKVISDYSTVGVQPVELSKDNHAAFGKVSSQKLQSEASIFDLLYNEKKELFYVILAHDFSKKEGQDIKYRPFSILMYDKNLKKVKETKFDYGTHSPYYCIATQKGLLVLNRYEDEKDKKIFDVYN